MKIAIISDIHAGLDSVAQDLCPHELVTEQNKVAYENKKRNYVENFISFIKAEGLSADYIFVPGDITDKAHPMEAKLASECLLKIGEALAVAQDKILFVPGNHDAYWKLYDMADTTGVMWAHRYLALQSDQFIFSAINNHSEKGDLFEKDFFSIWRYNDLIVVGYNSSSTDIPSDEVHCGNIVDQHLQSLQKALGELDVKKDPRLKIFMLHHHLHDFKLPKGSQHDYSLAQNGESLITLLRKYGFDFIVHGHRHYSCFDAQNCVIPIFCAGSFSANISTELMREVYNQFHIIEIGKKRNGQKRIRGFIHSWSNEFEGWAKSVESHNRSIVGHQCAFGVSLDDAPTARKVRNRILKLAKEKNCFSWRKHITTTISDLKYLSQSRSEIVDWCKDGILDLSKWNIFEKEENDVFFYKEQGAGL